MPQVEVNGVRLLVQGSGSGDALVLVHGSWDDRTVWSAVATELGDRFRVLRYDRRGHSGGVAPDESGTRRDDEDDIAAVIESVVRGPAIVVGNSFGASIVLGLAARRPELFRTLCVHEPPLLSLAAEDPAIAEVGGRVAGVLRLIESGQAEAAAREFVESVALGPGAWALLAEEERAVLVGNASTFLGEQQDPGWATIDLAGLGHLPFPVLLTHGETSPPFFATIIQRLAGAIPGAVVQMLPGVGHVPAQTHPGEYAAALTRFLAT